MLDRPTAHVEDMPKANPKRSILLAAGLTVFLPPLAVGFLKAYETHLNSNDDGRKLLLVEFRAKPSAWGLSSGTVKVPGWTSGPVASSTTVGPLRMIRILPDAQSSFRIEGKGDGVMILR